MMEAGPSAFLIMAEPDFLFKFLIIAFDKRLAIFRRRPPQQ